LSAGAAGLTAPKAIDISAAARNAKKKAPRQKDEQNLKAAPSAPPKDVSSY
jgi:hypothetical protein